MGVKRVTKEESALMITAYENGATGKEAAALCGKAARTFYGVLRRAGKKSRGNRKHLLDEDFFEVIDSEEKAYWLGFISADGGISKNSVSVGIHNKDEAHLKKLLKSLKSDYTIYEREVEREGGITKYVSVSINSKKLVSDLFKLGVCERKSLTIRPPVNAITGFEKHYWRGVIDGDGCIGFPRESQGKGAAAISIFLVGSFGMVSAFSEFISKDIETKATVRKHESIFIVEYRGNALPQKVIRALYSNASIFLDRKMILADKAMSTLIHFWRCWDMTQEELDDIYSRVGCWRLVAAFLQISTSKLFEIRKHLDAARTAMAVM